MKTISYFAIALVVTLGIIIPSFAHAETPPLIIQSTPESTTTYVKAFFRMTKAPSQTTTVYLVLRDDTANKRIKEERLMEATPSTPVPSDFNVTFSFSNPDIKTGNQYRYFLVDSLEENFYFLTTPKCFDVKGPKECSMITPATPTNPTQSNGDDYYYGQEVTPFKVTEVAPQASTNPSSYYFPTWQYTGTPTTAVATYISIKNKATDTWVRRNLGPLTFAANTPANKTQSFNFIATTYALKPDTLYAYYVGDSATDPVKFFTPEKCFTSKGASECSTPTNPNAKPGDTDVPNNPDSGDGTGTTNITNNSNASGVAVKGECGSIDGDTTSVITSSSFNLCKSGTVSGFTGSGPWSWTCVGANGGASSKTCTANVASDENLGDNFLKNPLAPGLDTFPKIFAAVVNNIVLPVAIPFLAIMLIYTGFLFVKARGKPEELKQAKEALKYTLIGAGLVLGAFVIANAIQATVSELLAFSDITITNV